jgi:hypothetical protein
VGLQIPKKLFQSCLEHTALPAMQVTCAADVSVATAADDFQQLLRCFWTLRVGCNHEQLLEVARIFLQHLCKRIHMLLLQAATAETIQPRSATGSL